MQDKMQSETADFAPVPPPGELNEAYSSIIWKRDVMYKTGST